MTRKKPYTPKTFESTGINGDVSANVFRSMIESPAWMDLTGNQKALYITCKLQLYGVPRKRKPDPDDELTFYMNKHLWADKYHLYDRENGKGFRRDMGALISHGFISCVERGEVTRTRNIYKLCSMWRKFGQSDFSVPLQTVTKSLQNQMTQKK